MDQIPAFDYDILLWGERQIRSVANMTRADARDFLEIAHALGIRPKTRVLKLEQANEALAMLSKDRDECSIVLVPSAQVLSHRWEVCNQLFNGAVSMIAQHASTLSRHTYEASSLSRIVNEGRME